jgi:hypothetical protein
MSPTVLRMGRALRNAVALALLAAAVFTAGTMVFLAACAPAPAPVQYSAEGRPQHLSEWHVLMREGARLEPNDRVVSYDLNTPHRCASRLDEPWAGAGDGCRILQ